MTCSNLQVTSQQSGAHSTKALSTNHNSNFVKFHVTLNCKTTLRLGHNFAHAMTAQLSWHVEIFDLIGSSE